ncbi:small nuclear ribonucleoprotein F [Baffinella frigidus]|nr:small nuclear ribonucleoprotein F [Cryptophyta sp. CCMP2293]|mmetsp:Transcript_33530/g.79326  ORF Transcript_33530/g.79326 Transcript_33530/m.79326 type:complete len:86 (+) Transcript_33530:549-806(+)
MEKKNKLEIEAIIISPKKFLKSLEGHRVLIKLKWGMQYRGNVVSSDSYLNIRLRDTEEWVKNEKIGFLGEVLIRCNNIKYISDFS